MQLKMNRNLNRQFFSKEDTDGTWKEAKYHSSFGNASQDYNEISPHPVRMTVNKKIHKQQMLVRVWREGSPPTLSVGM